MSENEKKKKGLFSGGLNALKEAADKAAPIAQKAFDDAKQYAKDTAIPNMQKAASDAKQFTEEKVAPAVSDVATKTKETAVKVKDKAVESASTVSEKVKTSITEEQMQEILNTLYIKSVNGIPKVSLPIDDLVNDYISKNPDVESAAKSLITNSTVKCGTSGFVTSFGGFASMIATLPANITSVMYVQLRMCCAIAKMAGYDITTDQVQTLIFACLTGSAMADVLKQAGVKFVNKISVATVKKIPGKVITAINQKVGFRFITKFGEKGIINLGKLVPVLGGVIGGGMDVASTQIIGKNAYSVFMKGEIPTKEELEKEMPIDIDTTIVDDIDTQTLEEAIAEGVTPEDLTSQTLSDELDSSLDGIIEKAQ